MPIIPITVFPRRLCPTLFLTNFIPTTTLEADPRFQYAAYIPDQNYPQSLFDPIKLPVLVAIHGTSRKHMRFVDAWRAFADRTRCAVIAPVFPCLVSGPLDVDGCYYLGKSPALKSRLLDGVLKAAIDAGGHGGRLGGGKEKELRHDLILLSILNEVGLRWPALDVSKVFLVGFSGGAQFAHRFMYIHPEKLLAVSIGAPGGVTELDDHKEWPGGVKLEVLQKLPILAVVGGDDVDMKSREAGAEIKMDAKEVKTRLQIMTDQVAHWRSLGLRVDFEIVPGAGHDMEKVNGPVEDFMTTQTGVWHRDPR